MNTSANALKNDTSANALKKNKKLGLPLENQFLFNSKQTCPGSNFQSEIE